MSEKEATYKAALELVARIDAALAQGRRHYRDRAGRLLTTLDEVVRAILDNELSETTIRRMVEQGRTSQDCLTVYPCDRCKVLHIGHKRNTDRIAPEVWEVIGK